MIDWLTYKARVKKHNPLGNGAVVKFDSDGNIEWETSSRMELAGSYESSVYLKSLDEYHIAISGNPTKYFQGHNLWGSNDVLGLASVLLSDVQERFSLNVVSLGRPSRVDIAGLIDLGSPAMVQDVLRSLGQAATLRNRGKGNNADEGTVYWGKHSSRWALKIYDKQREVLSTKAVYDIPTVAEVASGKLRVEAVIRSKELTRLGLADFDSWATVDSMMMLREFLENLELPDQHPRLDVSAMPRHLRAPFMQWAQGDDLRSLYPRPTFYRYRKQILELGVDIAVPPSEPMSHVRELTSNLVGFKNLPDIRKIPFWTPSESDLKKLPSFNPSDYEKPA